MAVIARRMDTESRGYNIEGKKLKTLDIGKMIQERDQKRKEEVGSDS